jgi:multiple sugar transport system permease protein
VRSLAAIPALGLLGAVFLLPLAQAVWTSLHRVWAQAPQDAPFVGLENYRLLLGADRFWAALGNTVLFTGVTVAAEVALGLALALLVHRKMRGRAAVRASVLIPWAFSTAVSSLLWAWIFHDRYGLADRLLMTLGVLGEPQVWLASPTLAMGAAIVADVWKTTP